MMVNGYRRNTAALPLDSSKRARLGVQGAKAKRSASTTITRDIELALKLRRLGSASEDALPARKVCLDNVIGGFYQQHGASSKVSV
jgi:hypothetical protein